MAVGWWEGLKFGQWEAGVNHLLSHPKNNRNRRNEMVEGYRHREVENRGEAVGEQQVG